MISKHYLCAKNVSSYSWKYTDSSLKPKQIRQHNHSVEKFKTTKQYSEVITSTWSVQRTSLFTLGRGRNCKCSHSQRMCVIAISHVLHTFWEEECQWFFLLNGNSCLWVMFLMEVERGVCFYLLWPQPWKGSTSNRRRLPSDARPSGQTFFGFLQQNMACNPGCLVSMRNIQFVLGTTRPTAGILQVSTFQLPVLIMGEEKK